MSGSRQPRSGGPWTSDPTRRARRSRRRSPGRSASAMPCTRSDGPFRRSGATASTARSSRRPPESRPAPAVSVDRRALALVCLFAFFGFGHEAVLAGVLPLVVIDRGGDAAIVGLLVAAYGIPTIVLRPLLGRLLDTP